LADYRLWFINGTNSSIFGSIGFKNSILLFGGKNQFSVEVISSEVLSR
jgi:hypothetical protein